MGDAQCTCRAGRVSVDAAKVWEGTAETLAQHLGETAVKLKAAEEQLSILKCAMIAVARQQPRTIGWLREHGVVFAGPLGTDPTNFEHVAFSLYTDICQIDSIARNALAEATEHERRCNCPAGPYNPGNVHESGCLLAD